MFRPDDLPARLRVQPFTPFRVIATEGLRYDIMHPDLILVGLRDLMIGYPAASNPSVYDKVVRVALVHVVALEELPAPTPASSNGAHPT